MEQDPAAPTETEEKPPTRIDLGAADQARLQEDDPATFQRLVRPMRRA